MNNEDNPITAEEWAQQAVYFRASALCSTRAGRCARIAAAEFCERLADEIEAEKNKEP